MDWKHPKHRPWRLLAGWGLILLGLLGCVLPILPGIPFLLGGLALMAQDYVWARRALHKTKKAFVRARRMKNSRSGRSRERNGSTSPSKSTTSVT